MKHEMIYVAVDADDIGEKIGNAVLENDTEKLSFLSHNINSGVQVFAQWARYQGGKVISSGSDEAILQVPVDSLEQLEKIRQAYFNETGFTVSIGIGQKVSDAAKALIYAKMNGKDQISEYSAEMDENIKQGVSEEGQSEGLESEEMEEEGDEQEEGFEQEEEEEEEEKDDAFEDDEEMDGFDDIEEDSSEEDIPGEGEEEAFDETSEEPGMEEGDEQEMAPEGLTQTSEEEAIEDMAEEQSPAAEDIDLDGTPDAQEEHGEIFPEQDDIDGDGDVEHEEAMAVESGEEEQYSDEGDFEDESEQPQEDASGEEYIDEEDSELEESIANEMGEEEPDMDGEDQEMIDDQEMVGDEDQEMIGDEAVEDSSSELRSIIFESLQSFKQNREHLEIIAQENPQLYSALIHTLQAMIEMARELGFGNMEEDFSEEESAEEFLDDESAIDEDVEPEFDQEFEEMPEEEVESEEEEDNSEESEEEQEPKKEKFDFSKSEKFMSLMAKIKKADKINLQEVREKMMQPGFGSQKKDKDKKKKMKDLKGASKKPSDKNSFCARTHKKKDCRSNQDANSPLCTARAKFNCRGKNQEGGGKVEKSEKLKRFLEKK